jgi:hypothetical protein
MLKCAKQAGTDGVFARLAGLFWPADWRYSRPLGFVIAGLDPAIHEASQRVMSL